MSFDNNTSRGLQLSYLGPVVWDNPSVGHSFVRYGDVEIQVVGTPSTPYVPTRSLDGTTFVACNAYDKDGTVVTSISAAGIYSLKGSGFLKMSAGAGSTITIRAGS